MAEEAGFEPTGPSRVQRFSRSNQVTLQELTNTYQNITNKSFKLGSRTGQTTKNLTGSTTSNRNKTETSRQLGSGLGYCFNERSTLSINSFGINGIDMNAPFVGIPWEHPFRMGQEDPAGFPYI